jgi:hypothetical protein
MPTLAEIIADKEHFTDDTKFTLANGVETTIGDLRTFADSRQGDLEERHAALTRREAALNQLTEEVAQMRARLEAQPPIQQPDSKSVADQLLAALRSGDAKVDIFKEPGDYFKPLVDKLTAIEQWRTEQDGKLVADRKAIQDSFAWHIKNQIRRDYRAHNDWPKDYKIENAVQYARDNKLVDEMGYPDFDQVHERVTAPVRDEARIKQIRDEARAEGAKEAEASLRTKNAFVPLPGGNGSPGINGAAPKRFGGIEKVPDADILNDPDIIAAFSTNGNA